MFYFNRLHQNSSSYLWHLAGSVWVFCEKNLAHLTIKGLDDFQYTKEDLLEKKNSGGTLLLNDDQALLIDKNIVDFFTIYSHHLNVTCVLLTQSIFDSKK